MKLSAQEEYGLRCLLHMARQPDGASTTIPEISRAEGLSIPNVAKLMRLLRMKGFVTSARGQSGGYTLTRPAQRIPLTEILTALGGSLFGSSFCGRHAGLNAECVHNRDCSIRSVWSMLHKAVEEVLGRTSLRDLVCGELQMLAGLEGSGKAVYQVATASGQSATGTSGT